MCVLLALPSVLGVWSMGLGAMAAIFSLFYQETNDPICSVGVSDKRLIVVNN